MNWFCCVGFQKRFITTCGVLHPSIENHQPPSTKQLSSIRSYIRCSCLHVFLTRVRGDLHTALLVVEGLYQSRSLGLKIYDFCVRKDVVLARASFVYFHAIISRYFDLFSKSSQDANLQQPPRYPDLLEHTKLLARAAPDPIIEEAKEFQTPETLPGSFAEAFAWFVKAIS